MSQIDRAIKLWMVYHIGQDPNPKIGEVVGWLIDEWPVLARDLEDATGMRGVVTSVGPDQQDQAHELAHEHAKKVADANPRR